MSQIRQHVWRHLIPLIALCVALQVGMAFGSERTFTKRFEVTVPARGLLQDPPSRDKTFKFELPTGYQIVRDRHEHGATVVEVNHRGLNEKEREITRIAGGVKLRWKLENPETSPSTDGPRSLSFP